MIARLKRFGLDPFTEDQLEKFTKDRKTTGISSKQTVKTANGLHGEWSMSHYEVVATLYEIFFRIGRFSMSDPVKRSKNGRRYK